MFSSQVQKKQNVTFWKDHNPFTFMIWSIFGRFFTFSNFGLYTVWLKMKNIKVNQIITEPKQ